MVVLNRVGHGVVDLLHLILLLHVVDFVDLDPVFFLLFEKGLSFRAGGQGQNHVDEVDCYQVEEEQKL